MRFLADDGKVFDTMAECEKYEKRRNAINTDIFFLKVDGTNIYKTVDTLHADYVVIKKEFDPGLLGEIFGGYYDGLDDGTGVYYWDTDKEKWRRIYLKIRELEDEIEVIQNRIDAYESIQNDIINFVGNF